MRTAAEVLKSPRLSWGQNLADGPRLFSSLHAWNRSGGVAVAAFGDHENVVTPIRSESQVPPLTRVGWWLKDQDYQFVCPTPETHRRVNAREYNAEAHDLRSIFGWSRPFRAMLLPDFIRTLLLEAGAIEDQDGMLRSRVRYSTIGERLFVHSAFPTAARGAVFLGPDTYRFTAFVQHTLAAAWPCPVRSLLDIGCGSGAGAIMAAERLQPGPELRRIVMADINPLALSMAAANAELNHTGHAEFVRSNGLHQVDGTFDLIISNPPYMIDTAHRAYCDGGSDWGIEIALRFLREALARLTPGGRLILYTGAPVINGRDLFRAASLPILQAAHVRHEYTELDPDVFGEDLSLPEYAVVERIAVVGLVAHR